MGFESRIEYIFGSVGSSARRRERKKDLRLCDFRKAPCLLWRARKLKNFGFLIITFHAVYNTALSE